MVQWTLSYQCECFICNKYQYTQIYYQRGILANNKDFQEVRDPEILKELEYQFKKDYLQYRTLTPIIMGSVVNRRLGQGVFERKLKMLRTPFYALLLSCQCMEITKT